MNTLCGCTEQTLLRAGYKQATEKHLPIPTKRFESQNGAVHVIRET